MYLSSEDQAILYNKFRPTPPEELISRIINFLKEQLNGTLETAVDVGCGSGQSTLVLAQYFNNVIGIDPCPEQINEAKKNLDVKNVTFRVGSSESLEIPDNSVQLITAGQCAHFFDMVKFYKEVDRVLVKGGVLAIYGYCLPVAYHEKTSLESILKNMFFTTINPYVSNESKLVYIKNYRTEIFNQFPFSDQPTIREEYNKILPQASVEDLIGYAESWSGFQSFKTYCGETKAIEALNNFQKEIMEAINKQNDNPQEIKLSITFKYFLLLGRKIL